MNIGGLTAGIGGLGNAAAGAASQAGAGSSSNAASDAFSGLLNSLTGAQQAADRGVTDIATGSDKDLHEAVMSVQMESLTFDLAVQIRNRLVDTYQEMFRMSV